MPLLGMIKKTFVCALDDNSRIDKKITKKLLNEADYN